MRIDPDEFAEQVDYLGLPGKLVVSRAFAFVARFWAYEKEHPEPSCNGLHD